MVKPNSRDVFLILEGLKCALSSKMFFVLLDTSEFSPPITPAIATSFSASQIISVPAGSFLTFESRVVNSDSLLVLFTIIFLPANLSSSNACSG